MLRISGREEGSMIRIRMDTIGEGHRVRGASFIRMDAMVQYAEYMGLPS